MWNDLRLAGWVRARELMTDVGFWLVLAGYHPRTRKFDSWIYLVYVIVFFAIWTLMVLIIFADYGARLLALLPGSPAGAAVLLGSLGFGALLLLDLYSATRRSPLVFSEEHALLLIQTPLDRRAVSLVWFAAEWLSRGWIFWAGGVVLGYALLQASSWQELSAGQLSTYLPVYLLAGLRMFSLALPLHLALMALAWAGGLLRLRGAGEPRFLRLAAPALLLGIAAGWALSGSPALPAWLAPLTYPIRAGLGLSTWWAGFLATCVAALLAVLLLVGLSRPVSLARAAQETREVQAIRAATILGKTDVLEEMRHKRRLGAGRKSTRLRALPGPSALFWKSLVQRMRLFNLLPWIIIAGLSFSFLLVPGLETRAWVAVMWVMLAVQHGSAPLRKDLSRWWLFHLLPVRSERMIFQSLLLPVIGLWLAGFLPVLALSLTGSPADIQPVSLLLFLFTVPGVALAGLLDMLRQGKADLLLIGVPPGPSLLGLLTGSLIVAVQAGALRLSIPPVIVVLFDLFLIYALWRYAGHALRRLGR